jgi:hypothetical protein
MPEATTIMRTRLLTIAALAGATVLAACSESYDVISAKAPAKTNFTTNLTGQAAGVSTNATGWANLVLEDPNTLQYELFVAGIDSITMAHFHASPSGQIIAWMVPTEASRAPGPGSISIPSTGGILRQNRVTRASLAMVAPFTWDSLVARMQSGTTYINVHTRRFPAGEIRGQIGPGRRE